MAPARANERTLASLVRELRAVREGTLMLLEGLPADAWTRWDRANGMEVSVRGIAWVMAVHFLHRLRIIRGRYLANG